MDNNPAYYAIITADVRYDKRLTPNAKLLYAEITALANQKGYCWSTNSYFAELYGVSNTSVSKWISQLIEFNYLESELIYKEGTKEILYRYLSLIKGGIEEKLNTPIEEKLKDNNTYINNTINIYTEKDFLEDWATCRKSYLNVPTNITKIKTFDIPKFNNAVKDYSKEQIREAMRGLFTQEVIGFSSMTLQPSHFLDNVDKYYNAFISKDKKLYGSKPIQQ